MEDLTLGSTVERPERQSKMKVRVLSERNFPLPLFRSFIKKTSRNIFVHTPENSPLNTEGRSQTGGKKGKGGFHLCRVYGLFINRVETEYLALPRSFLQYK